MLFIGPGSPDNKQLTILPGNPLTLHNLKITKGRATVFSESK